MRTSFMKVATLIGTLSTLEMNGGLAMTPSTERDGNRDFDFNFHSTSIVGESLFNGAFGFCATLRAISRVLL